jgi:hypothetical protein
MSLILLWENPTDLFSNPPRSVRVTRTLGSMLPVVVTNDSPLGVCEDLENDDTAASYRVDYMSSNDGLIYSILNADIRRQVLSASLCRINFAFTLPDGGPDAGTEIVASDESGGSERYHRTVGTNLAGTAFMVFRPGVRLLFRIEGEPMALDVCIPNQPTIAWKDLIGLGSQVPSDMRGRF